METYDILDFNFVKYYSTIDCSSKRRHDYKLVVIIISFATKIHSYIFSLISAHEQQDKSSGYSIIGFGNNNNIVHCAACQTRFVLILNKPQHSICLIVTHQCGI